MTRQSSYWNVDADVLIRRMDSAAGGLSAAEAARRLRLHGPNQVANTGVTRRVLFNQIRNPLLLVLVFAALASAITGEWVDAVIVVVDRARDGGHRLHARVPRGNGGRGPSGARPTRARVLRDGQPIEVPTEEVVPGDVVLLSAGSLVPADGVVLEAADFFVSEAVLTGESFPVEKRPGAVARHGWRARPFELRLPRHQRAQRHRALPDRRPRALARSSAASRTV